MDDPKVLVAAIDFGSSGSGYGFSFAYQYKSNPIDVCMSRWSDNCSMVNSKVPTVILFDATKTFHSFGFDAEDKYEELCQQSEQNNWYYFRGFKMQLYKAVEEDVEIRDDFMIRELCGKEMSAKIVFSTAIQFLKDKLVSDLQQKNLGAIEDLTYWVLTVPAIWNDSCKQFMREAAEKAGIRGDRFSLVYEPEAASIYARLLPVDKFIGENKMVVLKTFDIGRKFIVVDAGGGTVDISTQEVSAEGQLKIIHRILGGPWGGGSVNKKFLEVFIELIGQDIFKEFRKRHGFDFLQLMRDFERKKKIFKRSKEETEYIRIPIPISLVDIIHEMKGASLSDMIMNSNYSDSLEFSRSKLKLSSKLFSSFFEDTSSNIIDKIRLILQHERCSDVSAIMMVGGFSESEILQTVIKETFVTLEVFIPIEGSLSVLKGAVVYGHNPNVVSSRICHYTYGVETCPMFDPTIHSFEKRAIDDGDTVCTDIFRIMYRIDEEVKVGDIRETSIFCTYRLPQNQSARKNKISFPFYLSDLPDPFYVTDEGCRKHAVLYVYPPAGKIWPVIVHGRIELQLAGTEMVGSFIVEETGERTSIRFEFLPSRHGYKGTIDDRKRLYDADDLEI